MKMMHDELAGLPIAGSSRAVDRAAHYIQRDKPHVVVAAVAEIVAAAADEPGDSRAGG